MCQGLVGFSFRNISHVTMSGLTISSCGKGAVIYIYRWIYPTTYYGVTVHSVMDIGIANCSFQESVGTALGVFHSNLDMRGSNYFTSNRRVCFERYRTCLFLGGGIYVEISTLLFTGNITFEHNSAKYGGGIWALSSTLNFSGNSNFESNSAAGSGGGIFALHNPLMTFNGNSLFRNNSAQHLQGGGIWVQNTTLRFSGNSTFESNLAVDNGGGIFALHNSLMTFNGNSLFRNNSADNNGGGIFAWNSILNFSGNSTFGKNSAEIGSGGGIAAQNTSMNFNGNNNIFINNSAAASGGGIFLFLCDNLNLTGNINFTHNSAVAGGGMSLVFSKIEFTGDCIFTNNSAAGNGEGGGVYVVYSTLNLIGSSTFRKNSAGIGGGIYATVSTLSIIRNSGNYSGAGHLCTSIFMNNSARIHGGALYTEDSALCFQGCSTFSGNSAQYSAGGIYSRNSTLMFNGSTSFTSNSGQLLGGGIYGLETLLYFTGNNSFTANTAARGGGEYLVNSINFLSQSASVTMDSNNATEYGGAVYVEDSDPISYCFPEAINLENCPFQVDDVFQASYDEAIQLFQISVNPTASRQFFQSNKSTALKIRPLLNITLHFSSNHAKRAGSAVYGGSIDNCASHLGYYVPVFLIQGVVSFNWYVPNLELEPNGISSDPFQVCLCKDGGINCNTSELDRQMPVYPGQLLKLPVVATGQRDGIVPAVVRALFNATHKNVSLAPFQDAQNVLNSCTELHYQVHSSTANISDTLVLYAEGPCSTDGKTLDISLEFLDCPPGFRLNPSEGTCECERRLQEYTTRCNITERTLERSGVFWVGYDNKSGGIILHSHCPFDYCISAHIHINVTLDDTDKQCESNRSGLLCGECKSGFSLALGSSKCLECSNIWILLLIPFALAGIALVLLLFILKLTVAAGTINGLIFYANIVAINRSIFFPPNETNILTVFIAWLNLDLGIETCFIDGMDEYAKTWLQFVFPLYVWSLAGLIIVASEYSSRVTRVFGSNPVAVLATLFLLSYAKLLRTIFYVLSFTFLYYPDEVRVVWQYDGNIQFIYGKHIALFLVALLTFLVLFLPYTILLTVAQWLQAKSNRRFFRWINNPRIKPFLDAYQAPNRDQHRYWTGLMLCLRCVLFTVLVLLSLVSADPRHNLLAIEAVVIGLITLTRFTGLIYKKLCLDVLEASFILNLGILAAATYSVRLVGTPAYESQAAVTYTSVGIAFATFVVVLTYHTYQQVWPKLLPIIRKLRHHNEHQSERFDEEADTDNQAQIPTAPTMTIVERPSPEPLELEAHPLIAPTNFTELREPLNLVDTSAI